MDTMKVSTATDQAATTIPDSPSYPKWTVSVYEASATKKLAKEFVDGIVATVMADMNITTDAKLQQKGPILARIEKWEKRMKMLKLHQHLETEALRGEYAIAMSSVSENIGLSLDELAAFFGIGIEYHHVDIWLGQNGYDDDFDPSFEELYFYVTEEHANRDRDPQVLANLQEFFPDSLVSDPLDLTIKMCFNRKFPNPKSDQHFPQHLINNHITDFIREKHDIILNPSYLYIILLSFSGEFDDSLFGFFFE